MGAVSDWVNMGDTSRLRMWLLAMAVALLGSSALHLAGVVDLSKSIYPTPNFTWLSYVVGGFLFGVGMTLGSGCGSKTLIRVGAGNLKSLVVYIVLGIAAYMTLRGLFGAFRVGVLEKAAITLPQGQDLPSLLGSQPRHRSPRSIGGAMLVFIYCEQGIPLQLRLHAGRRGHRAGGGRRLVRQRARRPCRRGPEHPAGSLRRHQYRAHGVVLVRRAVRLHARVPDAVDRQVQDHHLRHRLRRRA